jgi:hypothetical protein
MRFDNGWGAGRQAKKIAGCAKKLKPPCFLALIMRRFVCEARHQVGF